MPSELDPKRPGDVSRVAADSPSVDGAPRGASRTFALAMAAAVVVLGFGLLSLLSGGSEPESLSDEGLFEEPADPAIPNVVTTSTTTTTTTTTTTATATSSEVSLTEVEWTILLNDPGGVHSIFTIAAVRPLTEAAIEDLYGFLVWDGETVVDLCNVEVRGGGSGYVHIGDGYQTTEGCGTNPNAMQEAFDLLGLPDIACVGVVTNDRSYRYCASLHEV